MCEQSKNLLLNYLKSEINEQELAKDEEIEDGNYAMLEIRNRIIVDFEELIQEIEKWRSILYIRIIDPWKLI